MRLVDADKIGLTDFEIVMCNGDYKKAFTMLLDKITNQPTAYDPGKVVREIRRDSGNGYRDIDGDYVPPMIETEKAIEIVKHSGSSDNVCEWKKSEEYPFEWIVGCDGCEVNHRQGDYCPRCGKKIKEMK